MFFKGEGSKNFVELDLRPRLTPMVLCLGRILSFGLKKKEKIRKKMREITEENISFPFILWVVILFSLKRDHSKKEVSFQN